MSAAEEWIGRARQLTQSAAAQCEEARQLRRSCRELIHSYRQSGVQLDRAIADLDAALDGTLWENRGERRE